VDALEQFASDIRKTGGHGSVQEESKHPAKELPAFSVPAAIGASASVMVLARRKGNIMSSPEESEYLRAHASGISCSGKCRETGNFQRTTGKVK
jgi:hypothetical protein